MVTPAQSTTEHAGEFSTTVSILRTLRQVAAHGTASSRTSSDRFDETHPRRYVIDVKVSPVIQCFACVRPQTGGTCLRPHRRERSRS
jgi:hypothetical protein